MNTPTTKGEKNLIVSTRAINFNPERFGRELAEVLKDKAISGVEVKDEEIRFGQLICFKLRKRIATD